MTGDVTEDGKFIMSLPEKKTYADSIERCESQRITFVNSLQSDNRGYNWREK